MAKSKADIKKEYPLPVYNYRVDIGESTIGFAEVSGLNIEYEPITYKESNTELKAPSGPKVFHMPGQGTPAVFTLRKGVVPAVSIVTFFNWINSVQLNQVEKKDIDVSLCDEEGKPVITWKISNAFPLRLDAPNFDASSNEVAIETMELMADSVEIQ